MSNMERTVKEKMRAIITGVGHYAPEKRLTNQDLERMVDTNDKWITTRTGIKERRILDKEKGISHMGIRAAEMALSRANVSASELDLILVATVTPDMPVPAAAAIIQKELGAEKCWGFDINGGCAGFLCAMATGAQFIENSRHQKVLVIGADKMSAILNYEDRNTCVLFGDGAGAVVLEAASDGEKGGIDDFDMHLDGTGAKSLFMEAGGSLHPATHETVEKRMHYVYQDGRNVFKKAINGMSEVSARLMEKHGLKGEDMGLLIPHQANLRIIDSVSKKLGLTPEQVMVNIEKYGNTTAGTIPIAMSEAWEDGRMKKGDRIILSAFGAGFTWGSLLLTWALEGKAPRT